MQERRLSALHPILDANYSTGAWTGLNGWSVLDAAETRFAHETVLDLSGYARDSLTFFPQASIPTSRATAAHSTDCKCWTSSRRSLWTSMQLLTFKRVALALACLGLCMSSKPCCSGCTDSSLQTQTSLIQTTSNLSVHKDSILENQLLPTNCIAIESSQCFPVDHRNQQPLSRFQQQGN